VNGSVHELVLVTKCEW